MLAYDRAAYCSLEACYAGFPELIALPVCSTNFDRGVCPATVEVPDCDYDVCQWLRSRCQREGWSMQDWKRLVEIRKVGRDTECSGLFGKTRDPCSQKGTSRPRDEDSTYKDDWGIGFEVCGADSSGSVTGGNACIELGFLVSVVRLSDAARMCVHLAFLNVRRPSHRSRCRLQMSLEREGHCQSALSREVL
ncbi:hypothetical protein BGW36DRAFT_93991 [Talaromyces proteolyticus]|uniref:Uncharacterized protein n=1 Tax=Talaromyces proteolyticus TaxID=1131652 RepID=A0AAD4Q5E6_9EURO|nr:uncharacterized protein BGW36DRAFT_93991 [Talaromyces proteolyticus]KAH8703940.1 hypothetical protein BGW36DRAFT_93991 [Talaromyces proteolyticus]